MSEPQPKDPVPQAEDPTASPTGQPAADPTSPDPLLDSGAFIDPDRNNSGAESPENQQDEDNAENVNFEPGVVIAAEPISMLRPGESSVETTARAVRRRDPDEMLKRPSWLPEDWKIDLRVRSSGATAGLIDRYYVEPTGNRKFRSKNEVVHYLETGSKLKRKSTPETDAEVSETPPAAPKEKSSGKRKKSKPLNSDNIPSPHPLNSFKADTVQEI
ncbi:hypothetical protein ABFS83_14G231000 [Erythranthe nasuta]